MSDESMRERVARAIADAAAETNEFSFMSDADAMPFAIAALRAMREPTEAMANRIAEDPRVLSMCYLIEQGSGADTEADPHRICADIWREMIDVALGDG